MKLNQKGFIDVIVITIIGGIVGSLFITGVFVWQEIVQQRELANLNDAINKVAQRAVEVIDVSESNDIERNEEIEDINLDDSVWVVYENFNLGFSLEYPEYFTILDDSAGNSKSIDLVNYDIDSPQYQRGDPRRISIQIQRHEFSSSFTKDDLMEGLESGGTDQHSGATFEVAEEVELGDYVKYSQYVVSGPGGPMMDYIAFDEDYDHLYHILVFGTKYFNDRELIEEIVSSFNFLD
jgi:hypothetical protein